MSTIVNVLLQGNKILKFSSKYKWNMNEWVTNNIEKKSVKNKKSNKNKKSVTPISLLQILIEIKTIAPTSMHSN